MKKILILEDDVDMVNILQIALALKYDLKIVHEAKNIPAALQGFTADLILLDNCIGLSKASEVLKDIQGIKQYSKIPYILFSAHPNIEKIALEIKANAFLPKPFNFKELFDCLTRVLDEVPAIS